MKTLKNAASLGLAALGMASLTGCGGFSATQGVSPASFFLPGLVGNEPSKTPAPSSPRSTQTPAPAVQVASAR